MSLLLALVPSGGTPASNTDTASVSVDLAHRYKRQSGSFTVVTGLVLTTLAAAATVVHREPTVQQIRPLSVQQQAYTGNTLPLTVVAADAPVRSVNLDQPNRLVLVHQFITNNVLPLSVVVSADPGRSVVFDNPYSPARIQHDAGNQSLALNYTLQLPTPAQSFPEIIIRKAVEHDVGRQSLATTVAAPVGTPFVSQLQEHPVARSVLSHEAGRRSLALTETVVIDPFVPALLPNPERVPVRQFDTNSKPIGLLLVATVSTTVHRQPTFQPLRSTQVQQPHTVDNFVARNVPAEGTPSTGYIAEQPSRHVAPQQPQTVENVLPLTAVIPAPFSQSEWPNPTQVRYSAPGYNPGSIALLSVPVSAPFSQTQWPNPLVVTYKSLHDDYLNNHWQIDYPPPGVTPPVTDIGGGIRKGIRYIPPAYYREKKKEVIQQEVEVSVITEVAEVPVVPELRNPVIGLAFREALAKVNVKVSTETIPQSVIEALSVPLPKFAEVPEKVIEADLLETSKLEALIEEDDEVISIYYLMNI